MEFRLGRDGRDGMPGPPGPAGKEQTFVEYPSILFLWFVCLLACTCVYIYPTLNIRGCDLQGTCSRSRKILYIAPMQLPVYLEASHLGVLLYLRAQKCESKVRVVVPLRI